MTSVSKILFVGHEATRTGAPVLFLNLLKWFKSNCSTPFLIILRIDGPLREQYEQIAPTYIYSDPIRENRFERFIAKFKPTRNKKELFYKNLLKQENVELVYANTATNGELYEIFKSLQLPILTHVHELEYALRVCNSNSDLERIMRLTDRFIVASHAVKNNLTVNHGIAANNMILCYDFIPCEEIESYRTEKKLVCQELNIPLDSFIICGSGTMDWRKGTDLFIQLANSLVHNLRNAPIYFLWVGGRKEGHYYEELIYDVNKLCLETRVIFLCEQVAPWVYYSACDVFALLSREDPFPLVCLDSATLGKPILCFEKSGGMPEFVEDDAGFIVPYLDIEAMCSRIIQLYEDDTLRQRLGARAAAKVRERHDIEQSGRQIVGIIESFESCKCQVAT